MIEVCCGSVADALVAAAAKASRIELNSALEIGGLTPSVACLRQVKEQTKLEVIAMVRPRGAGFIYSSIEQQLMLEEARQLLEANADGIAFGFLNQDLTVSYEPTKRMVELIHSYHKTAVFHRAFDQVSDPYMGIRQLIDLHVDRILTSGQSDKALAGKELLRDLQSQFGEQIELLAGGGITAYNVKELQEYTKIKQMHSSCKTYLCDPSTVANVSYAILDKPYQNCFITVDFHLVKDLLDAANQ